MFFFSTSLKAERPLFIYEDGNLQKVKTETNKSPKIIQEREETNLQLFLIPSHRVCVLFRTIKHKRAAAHTARHTPVWKINDKLSKR